jgi:hypothetical protein
MVHSGYEASAVDHTFGSVGGFLGTVRATLFGGSYRDSAAVVNEGDSEGPRGGSARGGPVSLTINGRKAAEPAGQAV